MKIIYFDDEINPKSVTKLIKDLNELEIVNNEKIIFYLTSIGGYLDSCEILIDFINKIYPYKGNIVMVSGGHLFSAGLSIFLKTYTKKRFINYDTLCMFHIPTSDIDFRDSQNDESLSKINLEAVEDLKKDYLSWAKVCGLNPKELSRLKKGEDFIFRIDRLKEICNRLCLEVVE